MNRDELNRLLNVLAENKFGVQNVALISDRGYTDLRVYSLNDNQTEATKDEGTQGS